jgi:uncharacterized protein (TIGR03067 family)
MRRFLLMLACTVPSLGFAPAPLPKPPKPDTAKEDAKKLQGTWVLVSRANAGRPAPAPGGGARPGLHKIVIAGDRLTFYRADGGLATRWVLTVDAKKVPGWFDRVREHPSSAAPVRGVYELKGDTLTMCYTRGAADRPNDFDGNKAGRWLEVYRRQKP